jgi:hypothetical protein
MPLILSLQLAPSLSDTAFSSHTIGLSTGGRFLSDANAAESAAGADE